MDFSWLVVVVVHMEANNEKTLCIIAGRAFAVCHLANA